MGQTTCTPPPCPHTGIAKLSDANAAGTAGSQRCTLILTEGDSAKSLAMSGLSVVGHDHYGVFPLRWVTGVGGVGCCNTNCVRWCVDTWQRTSLSCSAEYACPSAACTHLPLLQ
jgi:hypothetical protein